MTDKKEYKRKLKLGNLKEGRTTNYIKHNYGDKAFDKNGNIKVEYLHKALKKAKSKSLKEAIQLAINMRKWKH